MLLKLRVHRNTSRRTIVIGTVRHLVQSLAASRPNTPVPTCDHSIVIHTNHRPAPVRVENFRRHFRSQIVDPIRPGGMQPINYLQANHYTSMSTAMLVNYRTFRRNITHVRLTVTVRRRVRTVALVKVYTRPLFKGSRTITPVLRYPSERTSRDKRGSTTY